MNVKFLVKMENIRPLTLFKNIFNKYIQRMSYPSLTADDIDILTRLFNFIDSNNDGFITEQEIIDACAVDINNDGDLSQEEIDSTCGPWLSALKAKQDVITVDCKLSLAELLKYNNDFKGTTY